MKAGFMLLPLYNFRNGLSLEMSGRAERIAVLTVMCVLIHVSYGLTVRPGVGGGHHGRTAGVGLRSVEDMRLTGGQHFIVCFCTLFAPFNEPHSSSQTSETLLLSVSLILLVDAWII
jgi:hypothetical protein